MSVGAIEAVVFDMDGVLVDSEPLWHIAEQDVFGALGVQLTTQMCQETTGVRIDGVVRHWRARFAWDASVADDVVAQRVIDRVVSLVSARAEPMRGVQGAIDDVRARGLALGLASSSAEAIIDAVLTRLQVRAHFGAVCSAEKLARGKPDPEVYLNACAQLRVSPTRAVAVEDSSSGLRAAKNAGMIVIAVPDPAARPPDALHLADVVLSSLEELPSALTKLGAPSP